MVTKSHKALGTALHVVGSGRVLVPLAFILARGTGVEAILAETMGPAVIVHGATSWDDVGPRHGAGSTRRSDSGRVGAGRGDNDGAVGAIKTSVLGGEAGRELVPWSPW